MTLHKRICQMHECSNSFDMFSQAGDGRFSRSWSERLETSSMDPTESERKRPEDFSSRSIDLSLLPYPLPRPVMPRPHRFIPDMIDLNRLRLHRVIQVKQETVKPLPLWPPSPILLRSPAPYFHPFHPSLVPFPFLHFSPNSFYPTEAVRFRRRSQEASKPEKLNVHVDDSYYVDVGGGQKRWKCRMCEKSYTSKYNLITHILGHNGIKPHECNLCGKLFKQLSHLHTHMLTHQGTRPHKCQVCRHMCRYSDMSYVTLEHKTSPGIFVAIANSMGQNYAKNH